MAATRRTASSPRVWSPTSTTGPTILAALAVAALTTLSAPAAAMSVETECVPFPPRFGDTWETVDSGSGRVTRPFGTLEWTRAGVDYRIRNGYAVAICAVSIDNASGISSAVDSQQRGPREGRVRNAGTTGIGFGFVRVPRVSPESLPAAGADVSPGVFLAGLGLLAAGVATGRWWAPRGSNPEPAD